MSGINACIDGPLTGIMEVVSIAVDGIGQPFVLPDLQKQTATHTLTEDGVQQVQDEAVRMADRQAWHSQAKVSLLSVTPFNPQVWLPLRVRCIQRLLRITPPVPKGLFQTPHHLLMSDLSSNADYSVIGQVLGITVGDHVPAG